jgi:ATPase family associated with various cellular activities (AAA)
MHRGAQDGRSFMENIEQLKTGEQELLPLFDHEPKSVNKGVARNMPTLRREVAAQALKELWRELKLDGDPLIFASPMQSRIQAEHHPLLLNQLVASGLQRKKPRFGQLKGWERLEAPSYAHGIAAAGEVGILLKSDMLRQAEVGDRGTIPAAPYSWLCYTFGDTWQALSVYFYDTDTNDSVALAAIPGGHQDEWLAFLKLLDDLHEDIWRRERRGRIEIIGGEDELADVIKQASFDDVVLPPETLAMVAAQRRIFTPEMLQRYAALHVPRLRKVLLIGPPGTGKTTLLKAEGAHHAKQGGLVFYVCAPPFNRNSSSWQQLSHALHIAAESRLPTLVLVEDFEMFVSNPHELQLVLNTLDGVATPDNPAGTLLLATSNDPEKIDPRIRDRPGRIDVLIEIGLVEDKELAVLFLKHFLGDAYCAEEHAPIAPQLLKQPGSHFREVCIAGAMRALEKEHPKVLGEDLLWAHDVILTGRAIAAEAERFEAPSANKRGRYFGKHS